MTWEAIFQVVPSFDETQRWIANNGLGAVFSVMLILLVSSMVRTVLGGIARQITGAVTYFTNKLDSISSRQELALDKLTDAINDQKVAQGQSQEALRMVLVFMSQNMTELADHRKVVEGNKAPPTGVIKPVPESMHPEE